MVVIHAVISYNILYAARMKEEEEEEREKRKRKSSTHTIRTLQNKTILNYPPQTPGLRQKQKWLTSRSVFSTPGTLGRTEETLCLQCLPSRLYLGKSMSSSFHVF